MHLTTSTRRRVTAIKKKTSLRDVVVGSPLMGELHSSSFVISNEPSSVIGAARRRARQLNATFYSVRIQMTQSRGTTRTRPDASQTESSS